GTLVSRYPQRDYEVPQGHGVLCLNQGDSRQAGWTGAVEDTGAFRVHQFDAVYVEPRRRGFTAMYRWIGDGTMERVVAAKPGGRGGRLQDAGSGQQFFRRHHDLYGGAPVDA